MILTDVHNASQILYKKFFYKLDLKDYIKLACWFARVVHPGIPRRLFPVLLPSLWCGAVVELPVASLLREKAIV